MKISLCPICTIISGSWLLMSAGVAWGYLSSETYLIPISLLMGGTVVGIAYRSGWKKAGVLLGMPLAYVLATNLSKPVVGVELALMALFGYLFFVRHRTKPTAKNNRDVSNLEEQMKNCC